MINFKEFIKEEYKKEEGTQLGSNEGGIHIHVPTGQKHYIKHYRNPEQAKVEALTGKIYKHMGISTLEPEHRVINGKSSIVTKWNPNLNKRHPYEFESLSKDQANDIGKMYHAAILTKNWDIVGLEHDNILHHNQTGKLHAIDHGGSFHFRAMGSPKDYGTDIGEHESLIKNSGASGHVFSNTFKQHPQAEREGLEAVKNIDDNHIEHLFRNSGLKNWETLHNNFKERKQKLLQKYQ